MDLGLCTADRLGMSESLEGHIFGFVHFVDKVNKYIIIPALSSKLIVFTGAL